MTGGSNAGQDKRSRPGHGAGMSDLALSPAPTDDPLERVRRHVEAELFEPLTLTQLANVAGLSAYHISRASSARGSG